MKTHSIFSWIFTRLLVLGLLSSALMLFSSSSLMFVMATSIASAIGLYDLYTIVVRPQAIRFSFTLAVSILLGYGLGGTIYLAVFGTIDATQYQYWAPDGLLFTQDGLSMALSVCMLAAAVLYGYSQYERPVFADTKIELINDLAAEKLIWLGMIISIMALLLGDIGYMGVPVNNTHHVSPLGTITNAIVPPLVPYASLLIARKWRANSRLPLAQSLALLGFVGVLFVLGRRYLLYALVLSAIAWGMGVGGYKLTRRRITGVVLIFIISASVLYVGFDFFMALRMAVGMLGTDSSLLKLVRTAFAVMGGAQSSALHEALLQNVGSRPFILSYLAGLMGINSSQMPTGGSELLYSLKITIPSILLPGKMNGLPPSVEGLVHPLYGIPVFDGPNSFLTAGFDDFGYIGAVMYPLATAILCAIYYKVLRIIVRDHAIRLFVVFALLFRLLYIEQSLSSVFVTLRNMVVIVGLAWVAKRVSLFRTAHKHHLRMIKR